MGLGLQLTGAGGLLGVLDAVVLVGGADDGGGGELVEVAGGVDEGELVVEVVDEATEDELLVVVVTVEESVEDGILVIAVDGTVDETFVEVGEVVVDEAPVGVEEEAAVDEALGDTDRVADSEPLSKGLELTGELAEVANVVKVGAVAIDDAALDAGVSVAGCPLTGTVSI